MTKQELLLELKILRAQYLLLRKVLAEISEEPFPTKYKAQKALAEASHLEEARRADVTNT